MAALEARGGHGTTVLDLDYRPMFWASADEAHRHIRAAVGLVDVAVGNLDECEVADRRARARARGRGAARRRRRLAVVKQGPAGVLGVRGDGVGRRPAGARSTWSTASAPATPSAVRCATGCSPAGTSSGSCGSPTRPGAVVAGRLACADAMPTTEELEAAPGGQRHEQPMSASTVTVGGTCVTDPGARARTDRRAGRRAHAGPTGLIGATGRLMLVAADHPARGALRAGERPARDGRPLGAARAACPPRCPAPASTACSAPPTSSRTCCSWAPSTTRS